MGTKKFLWSLDISTTNIGCALWNLNGDLVELKHLELKADDVPPENRDIHKGEIFKKYMQSYKDKVKEEFGGVIDFIVVEEPLGGSVNQNTVSLLFGFNGICRYNLYEVFNKYPIKISVYESRKAFCPELVRIKKEKGKPKEVLTFPKGYDKKMKKHYIWEKVEKLEPNVEWFYNKMGKNVGKLHDKSYDMSDAYCVGKAAFKLLDIDK